MKESNIRLFVELIGAAAVLLGLIFVGLELRQNTNAVQASTLQGMIDISTNYLADQAQDPETMGLILKGLEDPDSLDHTESWQVRIMLRSQWMRYQGAFLHWQRGSLGPSDWRIYEKYICEALDEGYPALQAYFWPGERNRLLDDFVAYVETCRPDLHE